jgi:WD40 repeat protein
MKTNFLNWLLLSSIVCFLLVSSASFQAQTTKVFPSVARAVAWSPDGTTLAVGARIEDQPGIWLYDTTGQSVLQLTLPDNVASLSWSPSGMKIAAVVGGNPYNAIYIWDLTTNTVPFTIPQEGATSDLGVLWSPDGRQIASVRRTSLYVWDAATGSLIIQLIHRRVPGIHDFAWHPNSDQLWSVDEYKTVRVWEMNTGAILAEFAFPTTIVSLALSPDGAWAAFGGDKGIVYLRELTTGETVYEWQVYSTGQLDEIVYHLDWFPNGQQLIASGNYGPIKIFDVMTGTTIAEIRRDSAGTLEHLDLSPYGGRLALASNLGSFATDPTPEVDALTTPAALHQVLVDDAVQIIVPMPSLDRLNAIAESCLAPEARIASVSDETRLPEFVITIEALSDDQIPPGCKADLLAVAQAIQATE